MRFRSCSKKSILGDHVNHCGRHASTAGLVYVKGARWVQLPAVLFLKSKAVSLVIIRSNARIGAKMARKMALFVETRL
jgi:hypothetical protein